MGLKATALISKTKKIWRENRHGHAQFSCRFSGPIVGTKMFPCVELAALLNSFVITEMAKFFEVII